MSNVTDERIRGELNGLSKCTAVDSDQESAWIAESRNGDARAFNSLLLNTPGSVYGAEIISVRKSWITDYKAGKNDAGRIPKKSPSIMPVVQAVHFQFYLTTPVFQLNSNTY